jgi:hypothetical protein
MNAAAALKGEVALVMTPDEGVDKWTSMISNRYLKTFLLYYSRLVPPAPQALINTGTSNTNKYADSVHIDVSWYGPPCENPGNTWVSPP